ncbi:hypothetical protein COCOBI_01-0530 [Coccomyxa sp. Obi]|nr:hypothetical protein COCOBI_01-0530 [Coccomyxa sp. Obi]
MPPTLHSHDRGEGTAPVISLPTEMWQEIANRLSTEEWVRTCGSLCRTFYDLQPWKMKVTVNAGDKGQEKLRWTARHWKQAVDLNLHFGYLPETDDNLFGDLSQTLGEAKEAAAAEGVIVSVTPQLPMREDSKHIAAFLEKSLGSYWKNIYYLEMDVQYMFTIPPLHNLRMLCISMTTFDQFQGLLASICSLAQLKYLDLRCIEGAYEPEMINVGCLSCLGTLALDQIVPKAVEFPSVLRSLRLTGNAETIAGATLLPYIQALKSISISTRGNVSIVIPAVPAIERLYLWADSVEISIGNWSSFAARMHRVVFYFNHIKGEGFQKLQTLHTSGDLEVEELTFCNGSGATPRRLFSAKRRMKERLA